MIRTTSVRAAGVLALISGVASAQTPLITQVYVQNEAVTLTDPNDIVLITAFGGLGVNNGGQRLVEIDTALTDQNRDNAVYLNGTLVMQEGNSLPGGSALQYGAIDSVHLNASGNRAWNLGIRGATASTDSGLFFNGTLVMQEGFISAAAGFSPSTRYIGFFETLIDDNNDFVVLASVDDPEIATSVDRAIVRFDYNAASNTFAETLVIKEGDVPASLGLPVTELGTSPECISYSGNGQHLMFVVEVSGGTEDAIIKDNAVLAREGAPSPVAGLNYRILNDVPVCVNNSGQHVFRATLTGDTARDVVIIKNNETVIAREGDPVPGIPQFTFSGFGSGPVLIDDNGGVTWFGDWNDPDTTRDRGLFRNGSLVLQEGVTTIGENVVVEILGVSEGYAMSPDGRYVLVKVRYEDSIDAVLLLDFAVACPSDLDDGSGTGTPDDAVTIDDLLYFLGAFEAGTAGADLDNGTSTGTPDGAVTVDDLLFFLVRFEAGC